MNYRSLYVKSKWEKTRCLLKHGSLRRHIPRTVLFSKTNLRSMLSAYSTVYFKPTGGSCGFGIMRVKKTARGYETQFNTVKSSCSTESQLYKKLSRFSRNKSYLLQKGIRLARTKGKPFDLRVLVQKTNKGRWVCTAVIAKIGSKGKVVTNYRQGGKLGYLRRTLMGAGYNKASILRKEAALKRLGLSVATGFDRYRKGFRELGLDVALDSKGYPWILEVNTRPAIYPFKCLKNKTMYRRIISIARQYGRSR